MFLRHWSGCPTLSFPQPTQVYPRYVEERNDDDSDADSGCPARALVRMSASAAHSEDVATDAERSRTNDGHASPVAGWK